MTTEPSYAQICADLHNRIVRHIPGIQASIRRDLVANLRTQNLELFTELQGTQLLEFLSLIDNYDPTSNSSNFENLTPHVRKPDPKAFLWYRENDLDEQNPDQILLYGDAESSHEGGVMYDAATDLAAWFYFPEWPRPDEWVPLPIILSKWLELWENGKFHFDEGAPTLDIRSWVPQDLEDALCAWEALINAIIARLPANTTGSIGNLSLNANSQILSLPQLENGNFHDFAAAFLSLARSPPAQIKYIAPTITTWTATSFRSDVENEPASSTRRQWLSRRQFPREQTPVLLFPSRNPPNGFANRVPYPAQCEAAPGFDEQWGFGKFTLDRRAGVYLYPDPYAGAGDAVILLEEDGRDNWGTRMGWRSPWGLAANGVKLAEMLGMWRERIESGVWEVGEEGVVGVWR